MTDGEARLGFNYTAYAPFSFRSGQYLCLKWRILFIFLSCECVKENLFNKYHTPYQNTIWQQSVICVRNLSGTCRIRVKTSEDRYWQGRDNKRGRKEWKGNLRTLKAWAAHWTLEIPYPSKNSFWKGEVKESCPLFPYVHFTYFLLWYLQRERRCGLWPSVFLSWVNMSRVQNSFEE